MIKKIVLSSLVACLGIADTTYTLDQLITQALHNAPNLQSAQYSYDASRFYKKEAQSSYLPRIDLVGQATQSSISSTEDKLLMGSLSLKQLVYDFGGISSDIASADAQSKSLLMQIKRFIVEKKRDVKESYYKVLEAQALIEVQKENIKLNEAQLYRAQRYFEAGIRTKIDISDAKVTLIQAKIALKNAQYNLELAYAQLDRIVGFHDAIRTYTITQPHLNLESLCSTLSEYPLTLENAIIYGYKHRYEIEEQQYYIKKYQHQIKRAQSQYYPSVYIVGDYTKSDTQKLRSYFPKESWNIGLGVDMNLYAGGATQAHTQAKKIESSRASTQLQDLKLAIKQEITQAYFKVQKSADTVALAQTLLEVSKEKFYQATKRYEHGLCDYIELQQSRQGYIDAKATLIIDYYNYYIARAYLDSALGK